MKEPEYTQETPNTEDNILGHLSGRISNVSYAPEIRYRTCYQCGEYTHHSHIEFVAGRWICNNCIHLATEGEI